MQLQKILLHRNKHPASNFYSYTSKKRFSETECVLIIILPFVIEIWEIIFLTFNKFLKLEISIEPYKKHLLALIIKTISIFYIGTLIWWKSDKKFRLSDGYIWLLVLLSKVFYHLNLISFFHLQNKALSQFIQLSSEMITWGIIAYYIFFDVTIKNALKRFCCNQGFFNDEEGYQIIGKWKVDKEKVFYCLKEVCWLMIAALWCSILVTAATRQINQMIGVEQQEVIKESNNNQTIRGKLHESPLTIVFSALIFAPIYEELIYRHTLCKLGNNGRAAWITSTAIFAIIHLHKEDILVFLGYFVTPLIFGYIYNRHRNIVFSILIHFVFNFFALFSMLFGTRNQ